MQWIFARYVHKSCDERTLVQLLYNTRRLTNLRYLPALTFRRASLSGMRKDTETRRSFLQTETPSLLFTPSGSVTKGHEHKCGTFIVRGRYEISDTGESRAEPEVTGWSRRPSCTTGVHPSSFISPRRSPAAPAPIDQNPSAVFIGDLRNSARRVAYRVVDGDKSYVAVSAVAIVGPVKRISPFSALSFLILLHPLPLSIYLSSFPRRVFPFLSFADYSLTRLSPRARARALVFWTTGS